MQPFPISVQKGWSFGCIEAILPQKHCQPKLKEVHWDFTCCKMPTSTSAVWETLAKASYAHYWAQQMRWIHNKLLKIPDQTNVEVNIQSLPYYWRIDRHFLPSFPASNDLDSLAVLYTLNIIYNLYWWVHLFPPFLVQSCRLPTSLRPSHPDWEEQEASSASSCE